MAAIIASNGSVTPDRYGFRPTLGGGYIADPQNYFCVGGITYKSPRAWRDSDRLNTEGYDVDVQLLVFDDTIEGSTAGAKWLADVAINDFSNLTKLSISREAGLGRTVDSFIATTAISGDAFGHNGAISDFNDSESTVKGAKIACGMIRSVTSALDTVSLEARAIHLDYNNADESRFDGGADDFEITGLHRRTAVTYDWTPFDENESCSAFVMMSLVCCNTNRYARETRPAWSVPLFDNNTTGLT